MLRTSLRLLIRITSADDVSSKNLYLAAMSLPQDLLDRSESSCELCKTQDTLLVHDVSHAPAANVDTRALLCAACDLQVNNPEQIDNHHWHCLSESMWSDAPAVKVLAWRLLDQLKTESWAQDLFDMIYIEDEHLAWAKEAQQAADSKVIHKDSNGAILEQGDSVVLIKDLNVKGASFIAKRGTAVRRISLDMNNANHIEGRVNGQHIVILTQYVKKSK